MVERKTYYIVVFTSYNYSTLMYNKLKRAGCQVELFNTPCSLSAGCSQSIKFEEQYMDIVKELNLKNKIPIKGIYKIVKKQNLNTFEPA